MQRTSIDFGIDLGTTNSTIAVLKGTEVEVFKNNDGAEFTPSVVWLDRKERILVGQPAKNQLQNDPANAYSEFKLQMGTDQEYTFSRNGKKMKPEELSAEILKSLKADVKQRTGEDLQTAVITVPAAFELPQCDATKKAAQLAGFKVSPLLQEPVAAAMAYGFQSESDKVFWLVYDFGGGTFDAAVLQVREGTIEVVNHGGDNHLGGKLIDWEIVNELLVPAVNKEYHLKNFRRNNSKWAGAFAKLKLAAEQAKIRVSRAESTDIIIEFLCQDDKGESVQFEYELKRSEVERIAKPFIVRSINICRKVLTEKRLGVGDIEKVLLVGGTTSVCGLRELLENRDEGLGIPLDSTIDPLTVVARGAAIFAGTQHIKLDPKEASEGEYFIDLDYKPVGPDEEPLVGGRVSGLNNETFSGFTIEFINKEARPEWRSGKIQLNSDGSFVTNLWAEKGHKNTFIIELNDPSGSKQETKPEILSYTIGVTISAPPLIHSIGIALANNEAIIYFEKGISLPARKRNIHRTAFEICQGRKGDIIKIPVIEGENRRRADRNRLIGSLEIPASEIKRTIPAGSEVEITIDIDESRIVRTKAYIPILDEEFEEVLKFGKESADSQKLLDEFEKEKKRLEKNRNEADLINDERADEILNKIENENMLHDVETSLMASQDDRDAADKCQNRLLDLKKTIDEIEDALEWPSLVKEAEEEIEHTNKIIKEYGETEDRRSANLLKREIDMAIDSRNPDLLRSKIDELFGIKIRVLQTQPGYWVGILEDLENMKDDMRDETQAEQYLSQGNRAINNNDLPSLKAAVKQLISLLPSEKQQGFKSTVTFP